MLSEKVDMLTLVAKFATRNEKTKGTSEDLARGLSELKRLQIYWGIAVLVRPFFAFWFSCWYRTHGFNCYTAYFLALNLCLKVYILIFLILFSSVLFCECNKKYFR